MRAISSTAPRPPGASTRSCRTAAILRACAASLARCARARSAPITSVHADFFLAPHFGGFREEMDHVLLLDMAIHSFDALRCMTGLAASGVYCREWNPPHSWYRQGSSAAAIFDLDNGAVFVYRGSWCAPGLPTSWECAWRFVGEKGALGWDGGDEIRIEVLGAEAAKRPVRPVGRGRAAAAGAGRSDRRTFRRPLRFRCGRSLRERAGNRRARQYPFARDGLRRHRER